MIILRWMLTVVAALAIPALGSEPLRADKVLVLKHERKLQLLHKGKVVRSYSIALGRSPVGHKEREGDGRTPEGNYVLDYRNPKSQFYRSIHISYPNAADKERAGKAGWKPGGLIMIHGLPNGYAHIGAAHRLRDWTDGCIAVTNSEMDEIWSAVKDGTPIEIRP